MKEYAKSLIKRMESLHDFLHNRMGIVQGKESAKDDLLDFKSKDELLEED